MTRDELIELISDVTTLLGTALAQHVELTESISDGVESQTLKLDALKARMADEKLKLAKLNDAAKRKRGLARANQHEPSASRPTANESKTSGTVYLRDGASRVIGFMRMLGKGRTDFFSASGQLVAREVNGKTYTSSGKLAAPDLQGLRVLGQSLRK